MSVVDVSAPILEWAQRRSGRHHAEMVKRFKYWDQWIHDGRALTFKQVEDVARFTHVPIGYLFLQEPPEEALPIPDFRVGRGASVEPSDSLLDTIYLNQRRQDWYEEYLASIGNDDPRTIVGSARGLAPRAAAALITQILDYGVDQRTLLKGAEEARRYLIHNFESLGGLVVINSVVGNNNHRPLDLEEFRGFTLQSQIAPLVFINGRDTKNGQVFSLLHEFAHIWRGEFGVSAGGEDFDDDTATVEGWCNQVAAEIAVPMNDLEQQFDPTNGLTDELDRLAKRYCCSTLVVLLQLKRGGLIPLLGFNRLYEDEVQRLVNAMQSASARSGGNYYASLPYKVGETFSRAIIRSVKAGATPMTEGLRLLGLGSMPSFDTHAESLGEQ